MGSDHAVKEILFHKMGGELCDAEDPYLELTTAVVPVVPETGRPTSEVALGFEPLFALRCA